MESNEVMTDEQLDALIDSFENGEQADESGVSPEDFLAGGAEGQPAEDQQDDAEPQSEDQQDVGGETADETQVKEPGYVKGRIDKAVKKAVDELNAQWQARFDAVLKPLEEKMDEEAAQELVRTRKVGDIETARELVRLRKGQPAQTPSAPQEQPRQANGQFAPKEDPVISARIEILGHQAEKILEKTGIDVMAEFNSNAEIKNAVLNGEMDFYEVAEAMKTSKTRRKPPAPVRSPNGVSVQTRDINSLTDKQFDQLVARVSGRG